MRALLVGAVLATATVGTGCRSVMVQSDPPGASVFRDGRFVGRTPLRVPISHSPFRTEHHLMLELPGYEQTDVHLERPPGFLNRHRWPDHVLVSMRPLPSPAPMAPPPRNP